MTSAPALPRPRLQGLDLARYLAFVGMVIVNFKVVMVSEETSGVLAAITGALEGRAAATFVVLAGIGLGLIAKKGLDQTLIVTLKRVLFLLVIGLINTLIFSADIIHYYAFYFLIGAVLLPLNTRALILFIVLVNIAFVMMVFTLNYDQGWDWAIYEYEDFWTLAGFVRNLFFNGWHPVFPWIGFFLFGIIVSRLALSEASVQRVMIVGGSGAVIVAELLSLITTSYAASLSEELTLLTTTEPIPPMPFYTLAGSGVASCVIGVCLMVGARFQDARFLRFLVPAGRQTLTLYLAHILIGMGTLEALGMIGGQSLGLSVLASALFCFAATVYAFFWSRGFKRGPIEALMRRTAG